MLNNNINQLNEENTLLIKQQLPISSMKDGIIIPFYFNHNRLDSSSVLNLSEFKNNLDNSINNALKIINTNRYNNQIVYSKYDYKEPYQHIDFLNRSHPFSYIFKFNENDYLRNSFFGFDLHVYYDQDHDNVNGGINLHLKEINNFSFNDVLKQVYLSNFVEFFIENYLVPEIASIYPNLILAKSLNQSFVHQHSKDVLTLKNHIFSHLVLNWNNLVNEKFDKEDHDFLNNDFFYSLCNVFLLAINFLNVIRLVVINKKIQTFEKFEIAHNNYSTEQKENDFYLLFVLFNTYSDINFKTTKNYTFLFYFSENFCRYCKDKGMVYEKYAEGKIRLHIKLMWCFIMYLQNMNVETIDHWNMEEKYNVGMMSRYKFYRNKLKDYDTPMERKARNGMARVMKKVFGL